MKLLDDLYLALLGWYQTRIVADWYRKWSTWLMGAALVAPEAINFALSNFDMLGAVLPPMESGTREQLRFWLTAAAFVVRQIQQPKKEAS